MIKTTDVGVLLCNIGTPDAPTPSAVKRYLKEFLSDPRVVHLPRFIWQPILHGIILPIRSKKSALLYQKIWTKEGSPLLINSRELTASLEKKLALPVALGMNYGKPSIEEALNALRQKKITQLLILPLYPQYSKTTTASTFDRISAVFKKWDNTPTLHRIHDYADHPNYIQAISQSISSSWEKEGRAPHLLFSFHGIPKRYIKEGDPYEERCKITVSHIVKELKLRPGEYSLTFQSRLGKARWLTPYTDQTLIALAQQGLTHVDIVCPGFPVDCLETIEEIAIRGKELFLKNGGKQFHYIPALNNTAHHVEMLVSILNTL